MIRHMSMYRKPDIRECECCGREAPVEVFSSALGAISLAYCFHCASNCAEPLDLVKWTIEDCGGPDSVDSWVLDTNVYVDGKYVRYRDVK